MPMARAAPVAFLIDDKSEELRDGQARSFSGSSHVIEFDRGGELGTARYELTGGLYQFSVGDNGWELVKDSNASRTADRPAVRRTSCRLRRAAGKQSASQANAAKCTLACPSYARCYCPPALRGYPGWSSNTLRTRSLVMPRPPFAPALLSLLWLASPLLAAEKNRQPSWS